MLKLSDNTLSPGSDGRFTCDTDDSEMIDMRSASKLALRDSLDKINQSDFSKTIEGIFLGFQEIYFRRENKESLPTPMKTMIVEIEVDCKHNFLPTFTQTFGEDFQTPKVKFSPTKPSKRYFN